MSWTFRISTHSIQGQAGPLGTPDLWSIGVYSGTFGPDQNNPESVGKLNNGPIPPGKWLMVQLIEDDPKTGEYTIVLAPADHATLSYVISLGRGPWTFRIHGDDIEDPGHGSDGCIVAPRVVREAMWASPDHELEVVA